MRELLAVIIVLLILQGCTSKVEIPNRSAGIVKNNEQVETQVLKTGEHLINFGSEVIIYDISPVSLETELSFLFKDVSEGTLKIELDFKPIIDSLPSFYKKYQSLYVPPVVEIETRLMVRNLLKDYNPNELTKKEFEVKIIKAVLENYPMTNYVNINKVVVIEMKW